MIRIGKLKVGETQLDRIESILERIALALEAQVGIVQPGRDLPDSDRSVEAAYSTEADLLREEWNAALREDEQQVDELREADFLEQMREQSHLRDDHHS